MRTARVGDVAEQLRGVTFAKGDALHAPSDGLVPVLRAGNLQQGRLVLDDLLYVPSSKVRSKQFVRENDVVIAASSGSLDVVGKAARNITNFHGGFGAFLKVLRPGPDVDPAYFGHYFQTQGYRRHISSLAAGANINNLKNEHLDDLEIPLPPLAEQRRIAAILDQADTLRAKRRQVLAHLGDLTQATFYGMFGDLELSAAPLSSVAQIWDCPHSTPRWTVSGKICLRTPNLTRGGWNWADTRFVDDGQFDRRSKGGGAQTGDIILSREGTVGIAATVKEGMEVCMGQRLVQVRVDTTRLVPAFALEYLLVALHPDRIGTVMVGSTAQHLNVSDLRALDVPLPPLHRQREFEARIAAVSAWRSAIEANRVAIDQLFTSLQSCAFRGEL